MFVEVETKFWNIFINIFFKQILMLGMVEGNKPKNILHHIF